MEVQNDLSFLRVDAIGQFLSANGDILSYEGELWFSLLDPSLSTSAFIFTGGIGRWERASGHFSASSKPFGDGTLIFGVDGFVTPPEKASNQI